MGATMMTIGDPKDSPTLTQAADLCRDTLGDPTADELDRGLDGFLARVAPQKTPRRRLMR